MKLLLDQNLSHKLLLSLRADFPGSVHVRDVGLASATDSEVWEYARKFGFAIVSKDNDFSRRSLLLGAPPKIIWIRLGNCSTTQIERILREHNDQLKELDADPESLYLVIDPKLQALQNEKFSLRKKTNRISVDSSSVSSIGYDPKSKVLEIEFRASGEIYRYFDVPLKTYKELARSDSIGAYLNRRIKGKYKYERVL